MVYMVFISLSILVVCQYPVIFDKSHKGYKEKDAEENAWQEIASALDFLSTGKSC